MSDRTNSILKQANDGSSSSLETPKNTVKRRVSFSSKRLVQRFDKTDITIQFDTVTEEMDASGSSESFNSTTVLTSTNQKSTFCGTPETSVLGGLDATYDVFEDLPNGTPRSSRRSANNSSMNATCGVFAPFDSSTPRIEILNDSETQDDMDISFARTPVRPSARMLTPKPVGKSSANMSVTSPEELSPQKENDVVVSPVASRDVSVVNHSVNSTKLSSSGKGILRNSYLYRNSPVILGENDNSAMDLSKNVTPYRRRSLSSTRSGRSNSLRRSLLNNISFSVEGVTTTPDRENLSNVFDVDAINDSNSSQSFIKLASPARISKNLQFTSESPVGNEFIQDDSLVNTPVVLNETKEDEKAIDQTNLTTPDSAQRFLNDSYDFVYEDVLNVNSSADDTSRSSIINRNNSQTPVNKCNVIDTIKNKTFPGCVKDKSYNITDSHSSFLSVKCSGEVSLPEDQSGTVDKITSTTIHFNKPGYSKDITIVEKQSGTLHPIVEEEEQTPVFDKTINLDEVMARSEELKNAYVNQLNALESAETPSQDQEIDIFNETSGFSTDADMSIWNQSGSTTCLDAIEDEIERPKTPSPPLTDSMEDDDVQNNISIMDVSMRTVGNSFVDCDSYNVTKVTEGLKYLNPLTSVTYNDNYKNCNEKYQLELAIAFIQSILYNESSRHPLLKDFVSGFEKFAYLKNHMIKTEVPLDLDDLYDKVVELKNISEIIDDFRKINLDVYNSTADQLEVFFDTIYEIYFLLLDHVFIYQQKELEHNNKIGAQCSKLLNEMIGMKKLYDEDSRSLCEALNYIIPKYNL